MVISKIDPIAIVGAGAFGLSTALHLCNAGFSNITVFDKGSTIPSPYSAANDLNKIVRAEYEDEFYTNLALEAIEAWQKPLFNPHFHQVGFLHCVSRDAPQRAIDTLARFQKAAEEHPQMANHVERIHSGDQIRSMVQCYERSPVPGWRGYFNRIDGYAHAADSLRAVHREVASRGVKFVLGEDGAIANVVYNHGPTGQVARGVHSKQGKLHPASLIIVAAGAETVRLVPRIGNQLVAKSWSIAHVHLSDEEAAPLRGIPVTYARDLGFLFEPDPKDNLLKLCPMGAGFVNTDHRTGLSFAPRTLKESAFMPVEDELRVRKLLAHVLPSLADRPLVQKSLCWFADTKDTEFIIDYVPDTSASVILLSGDSGHGFKMFPIVGKWILDLLQSDQDQQPITRWRWKEQVPEDNNSDWGSAVSWRLGDSQEFVDIQPSVRARL